MLLRIKNILFTFIRWSFLNIVVKPRFLSRLIWHPSRYTSHVSYFPDKKSKSKWQIWIDQLVQTLKFGYPNQFYFPYGFDVKSKKEIREYLHYGPFSRIRDKNNRSSHSPTALLRDKVYFAMFTDALGVNSGKNVCLINNGSAFSFKDKCHIALDTMLDTLYGNYVFKPVGGECGKGIYFINAQKGQFSLDDTELTPNKLKELLGKEKYLVQEIVVQHLDMASLHPQSLNTLRLVTIRNIHTGEIRVFPSILRIGTGDSKVDNTSQGGLAVAVDLSTGRLGDFGFYKPEYGTKTDVHPDSRIRFSDFTVPHFKEAKEQAMFLHSMLPSINSIGWDIAIGENGPVFIEGNDNWEINGPQICNGPLKSTFLKYLGIYD